MALRSCPDHNSYNNVVEIIDCQIFSLSLNKKLKTNDFRNFKKYNTEVFQVTDNSKVSIFKITKIV